jgi:hypothetical protein
MAPQRSLGLAAGLCAALLPLLVAANVWTVMDAPRSGVFLASGGASVGNVTVAWTTVSAHPGDVVQVYELPLVLLANGTFLADRSDMYVVEGGEHAAFAEGRLPAHAYAHLPSGYLKDNGTVPPKLVGVGVVVLNSPGPQVTLVRPAVPPGGDPFTPALDLVWVGPPPVRRDPHLVVGNPSVKVTDARVAPPVGYSVQVLDPFFLRAQPFLYAAEAALLLATLVLGARWMKGSPPPGPVPAGPGEAAVVALMQSAGQHLAALRNALLATGFLLLVPGSVMLWLGLRAIRGLVGIQSEGWATALRVAAWASYALVLATWAASFVRSLQELRRWRAFMRAPPLGL